MEPKTRGLSVPVVVAFWSVAAFVFFNGILAFHHTKRVYENGRGVAEVYGRTAASARLLTLLLDAETGQRGFVLTGEERYLEPYNRAKAELARGALTAMAPDSSTSERKKLVQALRAAIDRKMDELAETIALRREKGAEASRAVVLTDRGLEAMREIREATEALGALEARELARQASENDVSYRSAVVARFLATVVGLSLVFFAFRLSDRNAAERARHAATRQEQAERFRVTLASIGDAVIVTDAEAKVRFMNTVAERLTGRESGFEGQDISGVFRIQDESSGLPVRNPVTRVLQEGRIVGLENHTELVRSDGQLTPIDDSAAPILAAAGEVTGVVLVFRDITERRKAERLLHRQKEALEESDRRKNEFLATLAHELRNPLAALRNAIEVLRLTRGDSAEGGQARAIIERQVQHMGRMVDDLIDVARISSGRMVLRRAPVELRAVVEAAVETTAPQIKARLHQLEVVLPEERLLLDGDAIRLAQVLTNLLSNAARYTEPGGRIEIVLARKDAGAELLVRDDGAGITEHFLPHVFDLFWQGPESAEGGLGIGLNLARRIVELHGGTIEATSPGPGRGSTFLVTLPLSALPESLPQKDAGPRVIAHRVLVVEDNPDVREALETLLRLSGYEVAGAVDGAEALAVAKRFRPTVALVDVGLPDVSGFDVARSLRADPGLAGLHLVAVTGWAQDEDRQRSMAAGFDYHLVKPVEPEMAFRLLASLPVPDQAV